MVKKMNVQQVLNNLSKSKFRNSFHLSKKYKEYVKSKGMDEIKKHAYEFINKRLAPAIIENDGKQTPMSAHPVFIAQHATATCCRSCLYKWYKIPKGVNLSKKDIDYIVDVIIAWISKEMNIE